MRFKRARTDANQTAVVAAFRGLGFYVKSLASVGHGFPDLLVAKQCGKTPRSALIEVKNGLSVPSARKLTEDEQAFHAIYPGELYVVESLDDVVKVAQLFFA